YTHPPQRHSIAYLSPHPHLSNAHPVFLSFFFIILLPPTSTLFPYTTLFRSSRSASIRPQQGEKSACGCSTRCSPATSRRASSQRSEEHTSELQSRSDLVCRLLLEKKKQTNTHANNRCEQHNDEALRNNESSA